MFDRCKRKKKPKTERTFLVGQETTDNDTFTSNGISTTRYNPVTFIPLSLLYQFSRYANIYFLINAILQSIPSISPLSPLSAIAPLIFVIAMSMLREGFEDLQRYRSDLETNNSETMVFRGGEFVLAKWKEVKVGDLLQLKGDEFIPADIVVLSSSDPKGSCFIMTSPLDGEKNLKPKFALAETQQIFGRGMPGQGIVSITCGPPTQDLGDFSGVLELGGQKLSLSAKQLLLRGAQLSNTDWVVGVATYTGKDSKIMNNSDEPRIKQSNLEAIMNRYIIGLIFVQLLMCITTFIGAWVWNAKIPDGYGFFVSTRGSAFSEAILVFFTMWILLNSMIPISLIISLEMVKLIQAYFMEKDIDMFDPVERRYAKVLSSSLNEELGQIQFIFSDKTGTLTSNVMEFKYCQIAGTFFGNEGFLSGAVEEAPTPLTAEAKQDGVGAPFVDAKLARLLQGESGDPANIRFSSKGREIFTLKNTSDVAKHFLMTMSLCHECMEDKKKPGKFLGPSPDEVALVASAKANGYEFVRTTNSGKVVRIGGKETEFEVLEFFEFSSARKRASIVIKHEGCIKLLSKGADSIIIERLGGSDQPFLAPTKQILAKFSSTGLRTLCLAMRAMSEAEWSEYSGKLRALAGDPQEKEKREKIVEEIESQLSLLGCTAVEDKLQDQVPEVIADFLLANIKVWMLTGDKMETAENIGYSCRLIQPHFKKLYLSKEQELDSKLVEFGQILNSRAPGERYCLIVEGKSILVLSQNDELASRYVDEVFSRVDSVVCCRMSPKQKGDVVRMVKKFKNKITLAIGDGANDTNMIQEADIGIGLYGREGLRAVQSSDYALPEFRALWKLLFVHGRWSYMRNSEMILYFYYKNIVFTFPAWLYSFYNAYSGQTVYDDYYITFYNLAFTAFPVIVRAVLDQDIYYRDWAKFQNDGFFERNLLFDLEDVRQYYPYLYYVGQLNLSFTTKNFIMWIVTAILSAILIFWFTKTSLTSQIAVRSGFNPDLWFFSIIMFTSIIFAVNVKMVVFTRSFTWINLFAILILSILLYIVYFLVADTITSFLIFRTARAILSSPLTYFIVLLLSLTLLAADLFYLVLKRERQTPLYLMFRSLEEEEHNIDKIEAYETLVNDVKRRIFTKEEQRVLKEEEKFRLHRKIKKNKNGQPVSSIPASNLGPLPIDVGSAQPPTSSQQTPVPQAWPQPIYNQNQNQNTPLMRAPQGRAQPPTMENFLRSISQVPCDVNPPSYPSSTYGYSQGFAQSQSVNRFQ